MTCAASLTCFASYNGITQSNTISISMDASTPAKFAQLTAMYTRLKESVDRMGKDNKINNCLGPPKGGRGYISITLMTMGGINPPNTIQKTFHALDTDMVMDVANDFRIMKENWDGPPPYAR